MDKKLTPQEEHAYAAVAAAARRLRETQEQAYAALAAAVRRLRRAKDKARQRGTKRTREATPCGK